MNGISDSPPPPPTNTGQQVAGTEDLQPPVNPVGFRFTVNLKLLAEALEAGLDPDMLVNDAAECFAAEAKMQIRGMMMHASVIAEKLPELERKALERHGATP